MYGAATADKEENGDDDGIVEEGEHDLRARLVRAAVEGR